MKHSGRNKWTYGGIITHMEWESGERGLVQLWNGVVTEVGPGDVVAVLRTGSEEVCVAGVEHAEDRQVKA